MCSYLTRNKTRMSIARLSPSFAVSEAALHQHPSHVLLLSPLLMILHKCSDQLLGQFLCSSNACPLLNCTGMVCLPPARFALWQPACRLRQEEDSSMPSGPGQETQKTPHCATAPIPHGARHKELVSSLIAPARPGFAPTDESPLLDCTRCQAPSVSLCCQPVLALEKQVVPVLQTISG